MEVEKTIEDQLGVQGIRKDQDVMQLNMSDKNLTKDTDLSRFKNLKYLWLNGNRLRHITCLTRNFRMAELYLQDNELVDINGALGHLTCLHTIMLQNNQLTKLEQTIKEFRAMQNLRTLNLSGNPIAQESEYRFYVIHYIQSLELLDRKEVLKQERDTAVRYYKQNQQALLDTISFGRRWLPGPPRPSGNSGFSTTQRKANTLKCKTKTVPSPNSNTDINENGEDSEKVKQDERTFKRSPMQYSIVDWSKIPRSQERRIGGHTKKGQIVTIQFR